MPLSDYPAQVELYCLPTQAPVYTTVRFNPGWSPSTKDVCFHAEAWNSDATQQSATIEQRQPAECIPAPEFGFHAGLMIGLLGLGVLGERTRARRRQRAVQSLRFARQRLSVRGWLREVFQFGVRLVGVR